MSDTDPIEVVLDHAQNLMSFDGVEMPWALDTVDVKAVVQKGVTQLVLTLAVDGLRVVPAAAPGPPPELPPLPPQPTPEQVFDQQWDQLANG